MPSKEEIMDYWSVLLMYHDKYVLHPHSQNHLFCFACGRPEPLQRSHILAISQGGTNSLDNLHLLCPNCHQDSERLAGEAYWCWFKSVPRGSGLALYLKSRRAYARRCAERLKK